MLTVEQRKNYFKALDLGDYNKANIKNLQKKYFVRAVDVDGIYGTNTDKLLVSLANAVTYAPHFKLTEFKCHCGSRFCTGYPAYLDANLLKNLETLRKKFGGPINISSGMRCEKWNGLQAGSAAKSRHIDGKAADITGTLTNTAAKRAAVKNVWYTLPKVNYCYYGTANMGTAVHVDVK